MNCPQCQAALQPGMQSCPACNVVFSEPVAEGQPVSVKTDEQSGGVTSAQEGQSLLVQQVTNVTGIPASLVPKWRIFKPVAIVAFLTPAGLLILCGLLLTGDIYKPEPGTQFFQPLEQTEKIKFAVAATLVQTILFVLLLSI